MAMICSKDDSMGRFSVDVELASYEDVILARRGILPPEQARRLSNRGVVDTGAASLIIPEQVARQLGLPVTGRTRVRYADGHRAERELVGGIQLSYGGRSDVFSAIVEPGRDSALIGAIVLEALDLIPDCRNQVLTPRDPHQITSEIE
jgi:predicted aspartyl protease